MSKKFLIIGAILGFISFCFLFYAWEYDLMFFLIHEFDIESICVISIGFITFIMAVYNLYKYFHNKQKYEKENADNQLKLNVSSFVKECKKQELNFNSPVGKQKIGLIADKYNIKCTSLEEYEKYCKQIENEEKEKYNNDRKVALTNVRNSYNSGLKYANYKGRNKRVAMLQDLVSIKKKQANDLNKLDVSLLNSSKVKEKTNWEYQVGAGLGMGTAGAIAGLSYGLEGIAQEQANKAYNKQLEENWHKSSTSQNISKVMFKLLDEADIYEKQLERAKTLYVVEESGFEDLAFEDVKVEVIGDFKEIMKISFGVKTRKEIKFDEGLLGVVDGCVKLSISNSEKSSCYTLVLPLYGVNKNMQHLSLLIPNEVEDIDCENLNVEFSDLSTWYMEK